MASVRYTVILKPEKEGGYHAFCPVLKGCHTQGDTIEEALENIKDAIELYIESLKAENEPIPIEDTLVARLSVTA